TRGLAVPVRYKGLVCTPAGWAGEARLAYSWPDAEAKARAGVSYVRSRAEACGVPVEEWYEEYFGVDAYGGPSVNPPGDGDTGACDPPEVIGRLAWRTEDPASAQRVSREVGVLGLSGPPTISNIGRGRDGRPSQLLAVEPFFVDRELVDAQVQVQIEEA
ncbi:MAG: acyclic terpene utilization AtuA family protein, partial [Acidimicrobiales bacterium]